ncbi:glycine/D-amino acid oxidase, deaminating [Rivularia sp. PCC 7116]|uniref:NAD(P)/FAD-dependent oxidoreductase n=1 Tax=Rivularia sp. PCC 7116 TaxID=373994 RepID=UPI00029EDFA7|nr:FAD-binding oxidoreductase [Rivularia sp. PCC 7116]AFY58939.1 glycine/D-amino acid oxidase, deaminating [Rivularia sp. PCC 7116]
MKTYDIIIIGAGIAGAALSYELVTKGFSVLLLEQDTTPQNATRYSYGGLAFWSGTTSFTSQLCKESKQLYQILSQELNSDIQFRELDLLLTIPQNHNPEEIAAFYQRFATPPQLLKVNQACELEPLLNREAISGALTVKHGHIHPEKTTQAYIKAFLLAGGKMQIGKVLEINPEDLLVKTNIETFSCKNIVVCAGGFSRKLLKISGIPIQVYFTHAEIIETPPIDLRLNTLVMPAILQRSQLEADSTTNDKLWNQNNQLGWILDVGAVQFQDNSLRLGQISHINTNPDAAIDSVKSEVALRENIGRVLPELKNINGDWHHCLVAFSKDNLPLIGKATQSNNVYIFSGFSNPLVFIPPLARRFANYLAGSKDEIITKLSPQRFVSEQ